jgi:hypothetical protein
MSEHVSRRSSRSEQEHAPDAGGGRRARRVRVWLGTVLSAVVLGSFSSLVLAQAAQAAPQQEQCWSHTYTGKIAVDKKAWPDGKLGYGAKWHWCGVNGKVTKFVVDTTWPMQGTTEAYVDIRPEKSENFGDSTYPIFINTTMGNKADHHRFLLSGHGGILWP